MLIVIDAIANMVVCDVDGVIDAGVAIVGRAVTVLSKVIVVTFTDDISVVSDVNVASVASVSVASEIIVIRDVGVTSDAIGVIVISDVIVVNGVSVTVAIDVDGFCYVSVASVTSDVSVVINF